MTVEGDPVAFLLLGGMVAHFRRHAARLRFFGRTGTEAP
jgi:hypothetical protein